MLTQNIVDPQIQQELLHWYIITKQNYFTNEIIIQQDVLAMGAPSSGLIAEIFLQHMEHLHLAHLTQTQNHKLLAICRHPASFWPQPHIQAIVLFNAIHPKLQFTAGTERDNTELSWHIHTQNPHGHEPPYTENPPLPTPSSHTLLTTPQHKYATVKFLHNRLNTYDLEKEEHEHELNIIHNILHNNSFPIKHKPQIHTLAQKTFPNTQTQMGYLHLYRQRNFLHH